MGTIKIKLHQQGWAEIEVDDETYLDAKSAHQLGGFVSRLDRLLNRAISEMDTEITITEPDGTEYQL